MTGVLGFQVSRVEVGAYVQRQHPHRAGHPQAALLHRPGRKIVQIRAQLSAHVPTDRAGQLLGAGDASGGGALLRRRAHGRATRSRTEQTRAPGRSAAHVTQD